MQEKIENIFCIAYTLRHPQTINSIASGVYIT